MAYPHSKQTIMMTSTAGSHKFTATAAAELSTWGPGYVPYIIRAVSIEPTTSGDNWGSAVWRFNHRDLSSGSTATTIATIIGVATDKVGHVIYKSGLEVEVKPGEEVVLDVTTAATSTSAGFRAILYVEPRWEEPGNNAEMRATT